MPKRPMQPEDLQSFNFVGDPQISPDGQKVLFYKKVVNQRNKYVSNLFTVDLAGTVKQWTQGEGGAGCGRWSNDGTQIAFVSGRDEKKSQIFTLSAQGGEARRLTNLDEGSIGELAWSPNGAYIAFSYRKTHPEWTQEAAKSRSEKGLSTPARVIDDISYRLDGDGYFLGQRYGLWIVETATGALTELVKEFPTSSFSFAWSPDSKEVAVTQSVAKMPEFEPANDQIFRMDLTGQSWMLEGLGKGWKTSIKWSPDGTHLAYLGVAHYEDPWGVRNTELFVVGANGGEARSLTSGDDYCLTGGTISDSKEGGGDPLYWSPDSKALYVEIAHHGEAQLGFVELSKGGVNLLTHGQHVVTVGNVSADGERIACLWGNASNLNEVGVYDLAKHGTAPEVLTRFNKELLDEIFISEPEAIWVDTPDGTKVHAWVMKPYGYIEPKRFPAILEVHGGPHTQYGWNFFHEFQVLASQGYVVVYSNPRGSKGYGEAHCAAIKGDWGNKDWIDIESVTRWMQHQPFIHPGQLGIMGGSYGGYMTNWAVSHTHDFKAAITDRCVSNLVSFGGNSDFPQRENSYWDGVFFDKIDTLWKNSPIAHFKDVKTPMLIIHSEGDLRCNIEQSEQVFVALKHQGIECRFVRYPVETFHGMSRNGPPDLRLHRLHQIISWWSKHLG